VPSQLDDFKMSKRFELLLRSTSHELEHRARQLERSQR